MSGNELIPMVVGDTTKPIAEAFGGTLSEVWQGLLGDKVTAWRIKRAAVLNDKLKKEVARTGQAINLDGIPEGYAFKWFQEATQADDDDVQELFARILANAAAGRDEALKKRNIDMLSAMSANDALMLDVIRKHQREVRAVFRADLSLSRPYHYTRLANEAAKRDCKYEEAIDALSAIGVLRIEGAFSLQPNPRDAALRQSRSLRIDGQTGIQKLVSEKLIVVTAIGQSLLSALEPESGPPKSPV